MAVGLAQHQRHPPEHGGEPHRTRHVAARAHHGGRPQLGEQAPGGQQRRRVHCGGASRSQRLLSVQRLHAQRPQLVARLRDQLELGALAADEGDLGAVSP